ncbi:hypothetical protein RRG08_026375 [Elysia crispata]|uniref:Uncharacterized protein n=1 Tax=Elysia crispata TaxID=231223 RepID=A0AAE1CKT7_9GAST|nr:hypothetical protein RRG08_026375 [Elysia crispata]
MQNVAPEIKLRLTRVSCWVHVQRSPHREEPRSVDTGGEPDGNGDNCAQSDSQLIWFDPMNRDTDTETQTNKSEARYDGNQRLGFSN